jgi:Dihydroprymidine dehydrogenase domain II, 4Fe-4S cluster
VQATDIRRPDHFHRVVDCQWACPAHTPVPEYIRLIAAGRFADAYMVNWKSNVFPGILGRTCADADASRKTRSPDPSPWRSVASSAWRPISRKTSVPACHDGACR